MNIMLIFLTHGLNDSEAALIFLLNDSEAYIYISRLNDSEAYIFTSRLNDSEAYIFTSRLND